MQILFYGGRIRFKSLVSFAHEFLRRLVMRPGRIVDGMEGEVLASNHTMLKLVATLDFAIATSREDPSIKKVTKVL